MATADKAARLRNILASTPVVRVAGAHNGVSARLVEANGFDAVWASGFEISASHALPDASILTMSELLEAARIINDATALPVLADCDSGFGEARNVAHMVRRYEATGIAAVCIEDKRFPKLNSFADGDQSLVPIDDFAGKIGAAKRAQQSPDFMVIARTEALIAGLDQAEALRRAHAYADAGADAILIHSKAATPHEALSFARVWQNRLPLVIVPTTYHGITTAEIAQAGIRVVIYANYAMRAAVRAMNETLARIHAAGSASEVEGSVATMREIFALQDMPV